MCYIYSAFPNRFKMWAKLWIETAGLKLDMNSSVVLAISLHIPDFLEALLELCRGEPQMFKNTHFLCKIKIETPHSGSWNTNSWHEASQRVMRKTRVIIQHWDSISLFIPTLHGGFTNIN
jgi:hypothetical protein